MKIRQGFVSNSSSSSFCIYGVKLYKETLESMIENKGEKLHSLKNYETNERLGKELDNLANQLGRDYEAVYSWEAEYGLIGRSFLSMKQDETRKEFETSVKEKFKKAGLPKPEFILTEVSY